jgi:hypothetical protein
VKKLARYAVVRRFDPDTLLPVEGVEGWNVFDREEFNAAESNRVGYRTNVVARCDTRAAARGAAWRLNAGGAL